MNCAISVNHANMTKECILHMNGVAEFMWAKYPLFKCQHLSREQCCTLGLTHDIVYIEDKILHEAYEAGTINSGAYYFLWLYISKCNYSPQQLVTEDAYFIKECHEHEGEDPYTLIHPELILLWCADMMVESTGEKAGEVVGFTARLEGIKSRFGADSDVYLNSLNKINWLHGYLAEHSIEL